MAHAFRENSHVIIPGPPERESYSVFGMSGMHRNGKNLDTHTLRNRSAQNRTKLYEDLRVVSNERREGEVTPSLSWFRGTCWVDENINSFENLIYEIGVLFSKFNSQLLSIWQQIFL